MNPVTIITAIVGKIFDRVMPDKSASRAAQAKINEAEVSGAPASRLRLWRSFLFWVLAIVFALEVIGRPVIATYWPGVTLPPSQLETIVTLLLAGLGF